VLYVDYSSWVKGEYQSRMGTGGNPESRREVKVETCSYAREETPIIIAGHREHLRGSKDSYTESRVKRNCRASPIKKRTSQGVPTKGNTR